MKTGTIPIFRDDEGLKVGLVSSSRNPQQMTFPKGNLEAGEALIDGALREMREEAGLKGRIILPRTPLVIRDPKIKRASIVYFWCEITMIKHKWPEMKCRDRVFFRFDELPDLALTVSGVALLEAMATIGLFGDDASPKVSPWLMEQLGQISHLDQAAS